MYSNPPRGGRVKTILIVFIPLWILKARTKFPLPPQERGTRDKGVNKHKRNQESQLLHVKNESHSLPDKKIMSIKKHIYTSDGHLRDSPALPGGAEADRPDPPYPASDSLSTSQTKKPYKRDPKPTTEPD